jgi:chromosome segregation ATPase
MSDLKTSAERLLDAVAALETHLKVERAAAQEAVRHARRQRQRLCAQAQDIESAAATIVTRDATIEELKTQVASAKGDVSAHENLQAALQAAESERDTLRENAASSGGDAETLAAAEYARDRAIAGAEEITAERDEALLRVAELETAQTGDARLREEAAEALDAAIGELKTLSGGAANG